MEGCGRRAKSDKQRVVEEASNSLRWDRDELKKKNRRKKEEQGGKVWRQPVLSLLLEQRWSNNG